MFKHVIKFAAMNTQVKITTLIKIDANRNINIILGVAITIPYPYLMP